MNKYFLGCNNTLAIFNYYKSMLKKQNKKVTIVNSNIFIIRTFKDLFNVMLFKLKLTKKLD